MPRSFPRLLPLAGFLMAVASIGAVCVGSGGPLVSRESTTPVVPGARLQIDARNVSVRVLRGEPGQITALAELRNPGKVDYLVRQSSILPTDLVVMEAVIPDRYAARAWARLTVEVPDGTRITVTGEEVAVEIEGPRDADVTITLAGGSVILEDVTGAFQIDTERGGVSLRGVTGLVNARTERGSIYLRGLIQGEGTSRLETGAGSIYADISSTPALPVAASAARGAILTHDAMQPEAGVNVELPAIEGAAALELVTANGIIDIRRRADPRPRWPRSP